MQSNQNIHKNKTQDNIKKMVGIGVFSALAFAVVAICQLIPKVSGFLSIELKDSVIAIASFIYGPLAAPIIAFIVSFLEFITFSSTGPWGLLMNFVSSATFSGVASVIYRYKRSLNSAIIGFSVSVVTTTVVMLVLNPFIVPMFSPYVTFDMVVGMILPILLPFNFAKALLNGAVAMLLYKPIIEAMRKARLIKAGKYKTEFNKATVISLSVGGAFLVVSLTMLILLLIFA